jgi:osmotically inducible lipoprotein OsmB
MSKYSIAALSLAAVLLAGCGTDPGDRALSGGLLGAGAGAAIGSVTGGAGTGAIIGGVSGAALGALTSPDAIDLGEPPWRHSRSAYYHHRRHYGRYVCHQTSEDERVCHRLASRY